MNKKKLKIIISDDKGVTLIELLVVFVLITILASVSLFSLTGHQKLYKPDEQAFRIADILQEARQRALTQRETIRIEIDTTSSFIRIIEENKPDTAADDKEIRRIKLLSINEVRVDTAPTNITYNPPESLPVPTAAYKQSTYSGSAGDQVCTIRFQSNGNAVDGGTNTIGSGAVPTGITLYIWSPKAGNSNQSDIARAITITGASGSIRLWEFDANSTNTNKWKDSRRTGAYGG
jgi:prepilin-type N-terminal cleavage/methylation domain-containing protein